MTSSWLSYNELAWTEAWLADPDDLKADVDILVNLLRSHAARPLKSLLHLGCGSGGYDQFFKQTFEVTGVDISPGMLAIARDAHPEVTYVEGDMRSVRLGREFDAVVIPDGIDYMVTEADLRQAVTTAVTHLKKDGLLLIVGKPREIFRDNNFAYTGEKDGIQVTLLENNFLNPFRPTTYEATLVYCIRDRGELTLYTDRHILGMFPQGLWDDVFADAGLVIDACPLEGQYDPYLLGDGRYSQILFVGRRR